MVKFCDIQEFKRVYEHRVGTQFDNAIYEMEKKQFCTDAVPIPKGATNGDMIRAIFPNASVYEHASTYSVNNEYNFNSTWWNAPYKAESDDV